VWKGEKKDIGPLKAILTSLGRVRVIWLSRGLDPSRCQRLSSDNALVVNTSMDSNKPLLFAGNTTEPLFKMVKGRRKSWVVNGV